MFNIAIVEDEIEYQRLFSEYVKRFADEKGFSIQVTVFNDGFDISEDYSGKWDVILLDIQMKQQDGISAAKVIRKHDEDVQIMFITTLAQYALHGYEVGAADYVLKPVEYEKFSFRFERIIKRLKKNSNEYMLLPTPDGQDKVLLSDILYIEVIHHDLVVHTKYNEYKFRQSMNVIEQELKDKDFFRCDRSAIVNLSAITKLSKDTVSVGEVVLPVSRARKKAFIDAVAAFKR